MLHAVAVCFDFEKTLKLALLVLMTLAVVAVLFRYKATAAGDKVMVL